jgi:hypothetical protein
MPGPVIAAVPIAVWLIGVPLVVGGGGYVLYRVLVL